MTKHEIDAKYLALHNALRVRMRAMSIGNKKVWLPIALCLSLLLPVAGSLATGSAGAPVVHAAEEYGRVIWKDSAQLVKLDSGRTTAMGGYVDIDLGPDGASAVSENAKFAIMEAQIYISALGSSSECSLWVRKNGTTTNVCPCIKVFSWNKQGDYVLGQLGVVGLDTGQAVEYKVFVPPGVGWRINTYIYVLGYIEDADEQLSRVAWKDSAQLVKLDSGRTTAMGGYVDIDLGPDGASAVSENAKFAIMEAQIYISALGSSSECSLWVRKNGTTTNVCPCIKVFSWNKQGDYVLGQLGVVGLDTGQAVEYKVFVPSGVGWRINTYIYVLGYIE